MSDEDEIRRFREALAIMVKREQRKVFIMELVFNFSCIVLLILIIYLFITKGVQS